MAVSKKITSKKPVQKNASVEVKKTSFENKRQNSEPGEKKVCFFCKNKTIPSYTDIVTLRKFTNDRAKINPKTRSGVCSKHQRGVAKNIKYARHLSILPFVPKV